MAKKIARPVTDFRGATKYKYQKLDKKMSDELRQAGQGAHFKWKFVTTDEIFMIREAYKQEPSIRNLAIRFNRPMPTIRDIVFNRGRFHTPRI